MISPAPLAASYRGPGLRVRFSAVPGATAAGVLDEPMYLPVVLGEFTVDEDFDHRDYDTVSAGQFSTPGGGGPTSRQLRAVDLEMMTIDWHAYARFLTNPQLDPEDARREVLKIGRAKTPFEILADIQLGSGPEELRMKATIRSVRRTLKPGEADTRYYTLVLKEWRDNAIGRRSAGSGAGSLPTTATLTAATTLTSLARHFYPSIPLNLAWRTIAQENGVTSWGASTPLVQSQRFKVGDKVKIPRISMVKASGPENTNGRFRS